MNRVMIKALLILAVTALTSFFAWGAEKPDIFKATVDKNGVQRIEMVGGSYYFKPNDVIVKKNIPVEIVVSKAPGSGSHSLVLHAAEAGIDFEVELSTVPQSIRFTPAKAGKYPFYCDEGFIVSHRAKGMEGVLEVTD